MYQLLSPEQQISVLETVRSVSFLTAILKLYSEIAVSRQPFGIKLVYIYLFFFLLRMADTMTSQNTDLSSWNILYNYGSLILQRLFFWVSKVKET
jgi:hypothetical protein